MLCATFSFPVPLSPKTKTDVLSVLKSGKLTDEVIDTLTAVAKDLSSKYKA